MTTTKILRITRWTTLGLIVLIALGIAFLEFGPNTSLERWTQSVADNAPAGTVAVAGGISIGGRLI